MDGGCDLWGSDNSPVMSLEECWRCCCCTSTRLKNVRSIVHTHALFRSVFRLFAMVAWEQRRGDGGKVWMSLASSELRCDGKECMYSKAPRLERNKNRYVDEEERVITRPRRQICPCGEGGRVEDGKPWRICTGRILSRTLAPSHPRSTPEVAAAVVARPPTERTHLRPPCAWLDKGQGRASSSSPAHWPTGPGPCHPCQAVWGKVERQHQMLSLIHI